MNVSFSKKAWEHYLYWQTQDRKTILRINRLILDILRSPYDSGIGKSELLKHINAHSRRIDEKNRITYRFEKDELIILSCLGHYDYSL